APAAVDPAGVSELEQHRHVAVGKLRRTERRITKRDLKSQGSVRWWRARPRHEREDRIDVGTQRRARHELPIPRKWPRHRLCIARRFHFFYPAVFAGDSFRINGGSLMLRRSLTALGILAITLTSACGRSPAPVQADTIIALERGALDRWGRGDPQGYLDLYARNVTYFDPMREKRIDGLDAMKQALEPIKGLVKIDRYEMAAPQVYPS